MTPYGKRLSQAIEFAGITQEELADMVGLSQPTVNYLLHKTKRGSSKTLQIAKVCGVSSDWLSTGTGDMVESVKSNIRPADQPTRFVPIISSIQAGNWSEAIDLYEPGYSDETVARINGGEKVFALYVDGDSMTAPAGVRPSFPEGYIIHVDPDQIPQNGDCVVAKVKGDNKVTFKQLKYDGDKPYLKPLNPDHKPIFEEFKTIGRVIGVSMKL